MQIHNTKWSTNAHTRSKVNKTFNLSNEVHSAVSACLAFGLRTHSFTIDPVLIFVKPFVKIRKNKNLQKMPLKIKKVLVSDAVDAACVELLKQHGVEVKCRTGMTPAELLQEIPAHDGLIVRSDTKVTREVIAAATNLKVVGRAGAGVDNIDIPAASERNIIVLNTPGGNSISACELTCTLMGCLARHVVPAGASMVAGRWDRKIYSGNELYGKTLAVLGLGRIGLEVARRMKVWGMTVIGFDPITTKEQAESAGVTKMELNEIWPLADYITVHTPLIPATKNLVNAEVLAKCKRGVKVINVARGGIIDEEAVLKALESGQCGGAAFDVYREEPPKDDVTKRLIAHPKVIATPHLGASTSEAQVRVAVEVAEQFIALAGLSSKYTDYNGVVNRNVLTAALG